MIILIIILYLIIGFIEATVVAIYFFADDEVPVINFIAWVALWPAVLVVISLESARICIGRIWK